MGNNFPLDGKPFRGQRHPRKGGKEVAAMALCSCVFAIERIEEEEGCAYAWAEIRKLKHGSWGEIAQEKIKE